MAATENPVLDVERHIKYWKRCHGSFLPAPYTSNDSIRLTLACFIVSSLDLLRSPLTSQERAAIRAWVLSLQHHDGGFCGSATHAPSGDSTGDANLAATFFALVLLALTAVGTGSEQDESNAFAGVRRKRLLLWLKRLQREEDGAVAQMLWDGQPVGGHDVRNSYMATGIRWMLRGDLEKGDECWVEDLDLERLVEFISKTQTHDGGGYTFCALAALGLLSRPSKAGQRTEAADKHIPDTAQLLKFLAHRQFVYHAEDEMDQDEDEENYVEKELAQLQLDQPPALVGCNGRWNKKADTCYFWWAGGALSLLGQESMLHQEAACSYLTSITQHRIGGFGKTTGAPPDIYHSYLGLAAMAVLGEPNLKELDAELCCSVEVAACIAKARDGLLAAEKASVASRWENDGFWSPKNDQ
ncbi:Terpenoid cylases/protein prenyltransferase alpha-alpha toroid [Cordyceps fumosorosea ARSEF 2679]|uniref:Terpenoid cylases/protein prenyltransferase alpha-alpha toroid n=1 Tax=Cordyceps fumosorosea (strain ARSEF 2679) TaxID=1081104 RepID=A0A167TRX5_CORFA|nr:Terpenoid cylases/protein prenyltransferase alpha-alpha toroid [Cordyceps fumosorosea ARSEF 2679]OAA60882.1 Terpenoid cylases/protein prenyltransferase alpha-alpha toroid [Cordyceps fumosorosea ARSEF 2679]